MNGNGNGNESESDPGETPKLPAQAEQLVPIPAELENANGANGSNGCAEDYSFSDHFQQTASGCVAR